MKIKNNLGYLLILTSKSVACLRYDHTSWQVGTGGLHVPDPTSSCSILCCQGYSERDTGI